MSYEVLSEGNPAATEHWVILTGGLDGVRVACLCGYEGKGKFFASCAQANNHLVSYKSTEESTQMQMVLVPGG